MLSETFYYGFHLLYANIIVIKVDAYRPKSVTSWVANESDWLEGVVSVTWVPEVCPKSNDWVCLFYSVKSPFPIRKGGKEEEGGARFAWGEGRRRGRPSGGKRGMRIAGDSIRIRIFRYLSEDSTGYLKYPYDI